MESVTIGKEAFVDRIVETYWSKEKAKGKLLETTEWVFNREM